MPDSRPSRDEIARYRSLVRHALHQRLAAVIGAVQGSAETEITGKHH